MPLSIDGNCRVKALGKTINLFGKYNFKSLKNKKSILKTVIISEQKVLKVSTWAFLDQNSSITGNLY